MKGKLRLPKKEKVLKTSNDISGDVSKLIGSVRLSKKFKYKIELEKQIRAKHSI